MNYSEAKVMERELAEEWLANNAEALREYTCTDAAPDARDGKMVVSGMVAAIAEEEAAQKGVWELSEDDTLWDMTVNYYVADNAAWTGKGRKVECSKNIIVEGSRFVPKAFERHVARQSKARALHCIEYTHSKHGVRSKLPKNHEALTVEVQKARIAKKLKALGSNASEGASSKRMNKLQKMAAASAARKAAGKC